LSIVPILFNSSEEIPGVSFPSFFSLAEEATVTSFPRIPSSSPFATSVYRGRTPSFAAPPPCISPFPPPLRPRNDVGFSPFWTVSASHFSMVRPSMSFHPSWTRSLSAHPSPPRHVEMPGRFLFFPFHHTFFSPQLFQAFFFPPFFFCER